MKYDIIVIGAGPGGQEAALLAARAGMRTALVSDMVLGGRATWGSLVPSKVWLSETYRALTSGKEVFRLEYLREKVKTKAQLIAQNAQKQLEASGVTIYMGKAAVFSPAKIIVESGENAATSVTLASRFVVIATGSEPIFTPDMKPQPPKVIAPRLAGAMETLPSRLLMIGGGITGVEYASAFAAAGVEVVLLHKGQALLPRIDTEVVGRFEEWLSGVMGVQLVKNKAVTSLKVEGEVVVARTADGEVYTGSHGFIAAGRRADTTFWHGDSEALLVTPDGAVKIDHYCQTSVPGIYAIGDVTGAPMTVNHAQMQARIAVSHILSGEQGALTPKPIVEAVYTHLPIGQIGETNTSEDAYFVVKEYGNLLKAQIEDASEGILKVKVDKRSGRIRGAGAFGEHAIDILSLIQIAMCHGITWEDLQRYPLPHPTYGELLSKI